MMNTQYTPASPARSSARSFLCLALVAVFALFSAQTSSAQTPSGGGREAQQQQTTARRNEKRRKGTAEYGRIELSTNPAGYPVLIDGKPSGETTATVRYIDLAPGTHNVEIQFPNGVRWVRDFNIVAGKKNCIALNFKPRTITIERSPCPYTVQVSAPASVNDGDVVTFSSNASYNGTAGLNYTWTVSPDSARIMSGQGTPTITVDSTGLGRQQRVTAVLTVDDGSGDRNCRQSAQASTAVIPPPPAVVPPRKFDEFPSISFDDDKARLDNLAIELQNNPGARGYILVYGGRTSRAGSAEFLGNRARNYLASVRGVDASRLVVVNGGYRERNTYELWLVPQGAQAPQPTPTVAPSDVRPGRDGARPRSRRR
ncbi:MAG: PEGA domain-containing protein [Pyrinomonadaceae bacterium]|nr:PEGA domain-containing protein [Pyrinomonadaceae bacterium]